VAQVLEVNHQHLGPLRSEVNEIIRDNHIRRVQKPVRGPTQRRAYDLPDARLPENIEDPLAAAVGLRVPDLPVYTVEINVEKLLPIHLGVGERRSLPERCVKNKAIGDNIDPLVRAGEVRANGCAASQHSYLDLWYVCHTEKAHLRDKKGAAVHLFINNALNLYNRYRVAQLYTSNYVVYYRNYGKYDRMLYIRDCCCIATLHG